MARKRYLKKTTLETARKLFLERVDASILETEIIPVKQALHRITAEPINPQPPVTRSVFIEDYRLDFEARTLARRSD